MIKLLFEDGTHKVELGPAPWFRIAGNYAQDGVVHVERDLFAKFIEETQMWHCFPTENFWPVMVVKSVPGRITA